MDDLAELIGRIWRRGNRRNWQMTTEVPTTPPPAALDQAARLAAFDDRLGRLLAECDALQAEADDLDLNWQQKRLCREHLLWARGQVTKARAAAHVAADHARQFLARAAAREAVARRDAGGNHGVA